MLNPVTIENTSYLTPSWEEMGVLTVKIADGVNQLNGSFDRLIALGTGGLAWARQLQDLLAIPSLSTIQISFYKDIGETHASPTVIQSLPISIAGERILIYDDVVDSGKTLSLARDYLMLHGAKNVRTATHFQKPQTKLKADVAAHETESWIIFPHEARETSTLLKEKWQATEEELKKRLESLEFHPELIEYVLNTQKE